MQKKEYKKGFSIGEVLIAAFILTVGVVSAVTLLTRSIVDTIDSRNLVIASQLAQEGTELVRNQRDNNTVTGSLIFDHFPADGGGPEYCSMDYRSDLICVSGAVETLLYNGEKFYEHQSGNPTSFSRRIVIARDGSLATVDSMVVWQEGVFPPDPKGCTFSQKCVRATSKLTEWHVDDGI